MGLPVLILGESGSGKTASLRNMLNTECYVFNVAGKEFSFKNKNKLMKANNCGYSDIKDLLLKAMNKPDNQIKTFVIDDSQYLMAFELFGKAKETGYGKFTDIAVHFRDLLNFIVTVLPKDYIVYLFHHVDRTDDGRIKAKTSGKMLDNQLTIEGLFTNVIMCTVNQGKYEFMVHDRDGISPVKTPIGMFEEEYIENDLKLVDKAIREYYEF